MRKHLLSSTVSSFAIAALSASALLLAPTAARAANQTVGDASTVVLVTGNTGEFTGTSTGTANPPAGVLTIGDGITAGAITSDHGGTTAGTGVGVVTATVTGSTSSTVGLGSNTNYLNSVNINGSASGNTVATTGSVYTNNLTITNATQTVSGTTTATALSLATNGHGTFTGAANTATLSLANGGNGSFVGGLTTGTSTALAGTNYITTGATSTLGATSLTGATSIITANGGAVTNTLSSLSVDGTSTATLSGAGTSTVSGTATVASGGVLNLSSNTANNVGTLAAATGSTVNVNANSTITTLGTGSGNLSVASNKVATITNGVSGTHTFTFTSSGNVAADSSSITTSTASTAMDLSGSAVTFNAANTAGAGNVTSYTIASGTGTGDTVKGAASYTFTNEQGGYTYVHHLVGDDVNIVQIKNSAFTAGTPGGTDDTISHNSLTNYLEQHVIGASSDTGTVASYIANVGGTSAGAQKTGYLNQAGTQTTMQVSNNFATGFMNVVSDRTGVMQGMHVASNDGAGLSSGDASSGRAVWVQAFGSVARQDSRGGEAGFDTDDGGFALGFEQKLSQYSAVGVAASYGAGQFQSNDQYAPKTTSSDDYQLSLYGNSYVMPNWYVEGQIGGGYHTFDEGNTYIGVGTASADYHGWGYFGQIGTGYDFHTATPAIVTPFAKLAYQALDFDSYTESGAGALDRSVGSDTAQTLTGYLGAKVAWQSLTYWGTKFTPELRAAYLHDFEQEGLSTSANFVGTGNGSTYTTSGQGLAKDGFTVGAGVNVAQSNGWDVIANYDYENRDGYNGHSGTLTAKYAF